MDNPDCYLCFFFLLPAYGDVCQFKWFALKPWQNLDKNYTWCKRTDIGGIHDVVLNPPLFESHSFPCGCLATPLQHNILWISGVKRDRCLLKPTSQGCSPVIHAFFWRCCDASLGCNTVWSSKNMCTTRMHVHAHAETHNKQATSQTKEIHRNLEQEQCWGRCWFLLRWSVEIRDIMLHMKKRDLRYEKN